MTFKEFMTGVAYVPASVLNGIVSLTLGSTAKNKKGEVEYDYEGNPVANPGLLGLVLDSVKYVGRSFADLIADHKKAIAVAFWSSLALGGAAALTVFLWPAALTAVTTFSIYGYSIAGVVGANTLLQIGAVGALSFAATSVATYLTAALANTISAIVSFCRPAKKDPSLLATLDESSSNEDDFGHGNSTTLMQDQFKKLATPVVTSKVEPAPLHVDSPLHKEVSKSKSHDEPVLEQTADKVLSV